MLLEIYHRKSGCVINPQRDLDERHNVAGLNTFPKCKKFYSFANIIILVLLFFLENVKYYER